MKHGFAFIATILVALLLTLLVGECSQGQSCPNGQCPMARPAVTKPVAKAVVSGPAKTVAAVSNACKTKCCERPRFRLFRRLRGCR